MARERSFDEWSAQMTTSQSAQSNNPFRRKPVGSDALVDTSTTARPDQTAAVPGSCTTSPRIDPTALPIEGNDTASPWGRRNISGAARYLARVTNTGDDITGDDSGGAAPTYQRSNTFQGGQRMGYIHGDGHAMPVLPMSSPPPTYPEAMASTPADIPVEPLQHDHVPLSKTRPSNTTFEERLPLHLATPCDYADSSSSQGTTHNQQASSAQRDDAPREPLYQDVKTMYEKDLRQGYNGACYDSGRFRPNDSFAPNDHFAQSSSRASSSPFTPNSSFSSPGPFSQTNPISQVSPFQQHSPIPHGSFQPPNMPNGLSPQGDPYQHAGYSQQGSPLGFINPNYSFAHPGQSPYGNHYTSGHFAQQMNSFPPGPPFLHPSQYPYGGYAIPGGVSLFTFQQAHGFGFMPHHISSYPAQVQPHGGMDLGSGLGSPADAFTQQRNSNEGQAAFRKASPSLLDDLASALPASPAKAVEMPRPSANLQGMKELNILILGETGVGKSTFINAFANYLAFRTLDHAIDEKELKCVIPSTFTWQSLDGNEHISQQIVVQPNSDGHADAASLANERDGSGGQSATQETKTYEMKIDGTTVRLLDTPGIGDTRGSAQDKQNMDNILAQLRTVGDLHGILILLKPNNARLTLMFNFCIKELLTYLHQDAAKNIVFGFTNARNTSFRPGDTYGVLKSMLEGTAYRSVGISLNRHITYCFDSESFRCLAAHQSGVDINDMGDIQDYKLSWEKSALETYRMLEHFRPDVTKPHQVSQTWNLYQTRELVRILTIPMADITQTINNNIALQEDQRFELAEAVSKGGSLESALHLDKIEYEMRPLPKPRTVCSAPECTEYHDDKKIYKSLCHDPCSLNNVQVDKIRCEELLQCYAFGCGTSQDCSVCGHSWQVHLHILWEPVEVTKQAIDEAVQKRLMENASGVEVMEEAIRSREKLINKYKRERETIQKAAGQFAVFLKNSAITAYNDSKLKYLDHLIEEERAKVQAGGNDKRLRDLLSDRRQHEEEVKTLNEYAKAGASSKLLDQDGIKDLISQLFNLELTGPNLSKVATQLEGIYDSTKAGKKRRSASKRVAGSGGFLAAIKSRAPVTPKAVEWPYTTAPDQPSGADFGGGGGYSFSPPQAALAAPSFQQMLVSPKSKSRLGIGKLIKKMKK